MRPTRALLLHAITAAAGVACALGGVAAFRGAGLPFPRPAPPPGYVAEHAGHTTVYAPTAAAARQGQRDVRLGRDRFRAIFGARASRLVVVLADDPAHFAGLDLEPLRTRGARLVPFLTSARLRSAGGTAGVAGGHGAPAGAPPAALLAHEACHAYVAALADRDAGPGGAAHGRYGHPALPDWFEEAAATLCENPESRAGRRRHFREQAGERIPLRRFQRMPHPLGGAEMLRRLGITPVPGRAEVHVLTPDRIRRALPRSDYVLFYSQALSLGEFILARGGPGAMRSLARDLANGRTLDQALARAHRTAPALPATVDALEAEWIRWVQRGG